MGRKNQRQAHRDRPGNGDIGGNTHVESDLQHGANLAAARVQRLLFRPNG